MSLVDGKPLELDELAPETGAARRRAPGPRVPRRRPYAEDIGSGPAGKRCRDCAHLERLNQGRAIYKCGVQPQTSDHGTDIGAMDPACANFERRVERAELGDVQTLGTLGQSDAWWRSAWQLHRDVDALSALAGLPAADVRARLQALGIELRGRPSNSRPTLPLMPAAPRKRSRKGRSHGRDG